MHNLLLLFFIPYSLDVKLVSKVTYTDLPKLFSPVLSYPNRVKASAWVSIPGHPLALEVTTPC
jgi:hypothetical protein